MTLKISASRLMVHIRRRGSFAENAQDFGRRLPLAKNASSLCTGSFAKNAQDFGRRLPLAKDASSRLLVASTC